MLPKHDGTFFLTSTYRQHWWKRAKGERNVSYCWFSFFVIHRPIASQQQIGHSWKLILRKAQQMAREESIRKRRKMVVKMVKPFLRWIWRDCHHQYVSWSYQVRLLHTKFLNSTFVNPYSKIIWQMSFVFWNSFWLWDEEKMKFQRLHFDDSETFFHMYILNTFCTLPRYT